MAAGPTAITMMPLGDTSHDKPATFLVHAYGRIELIVGDRIALFDAPACQQLQRVLEGIDSYMGVDGVYLGWATGEPGKTRTFSILIDGDSYHEFYRPTDAARAAAQLLTARTAARPVQPTAGVDEVQRDGQSVIDRARFAANAKGYATQGHTVSRRRAGGAWLGALRSRRTKRVGAFGGTVYRRIGTEDRRPAPVQRAQASACASSTHPDATRAVDANDPGARSPHRRAGATAARPRRPHPGPGARPKGRAGHGCILSATAKRRRSATLRRRRPFAPWQSPLRCGMIHGG